MSVVSGKLLQSKVSAGQLDSFGASLRTFVPAYQICPPPSAFDQYGRDAPPQSINTQNCAGAFSPLSRILVENANRPFISERYNNLPIGVSGGADTMFGHANSNRANAFGNINEVKYPLTDNKDSFLGAKNSSTDSSIIYPKKTPVA